MAFEQLNKAELTEVAKTFGVDWTTESPTKNEMIKDLDDEGVSWKMYKQAYPDPEPEEEEVIDEGLDFDPEEEAAAGDAADELTPEPAEKKFTPRAKQPVLIKMTRANPSYEVRGYNFTKKHPFLPVSPDDADFLVGVLGGFAIATPAEVEEFYS